MATDQQRPTSLRVAIIASVRRGGLPNTREPRRSRSTALTAAARWLQTRSSGVQAARATAGRPVPRRMEPANARAAPARSGRGSLQAKAAARSSMRRGDRGVPRGMECESGICARGPRSVGRCPDG